MIKVSIIGSGNVAHHLARAFETSPEAHLLQILVRDPANAKNFPFKDKIIHNIDNLLEADLYIIAVSDSAVTSVSESLKFTGRMVAHTSGSIPLTGLNAKNRRGVFYPLQTFSKEKAIDFHEVPLCLESENPADYDILEKAANAISRNIFSINSEQRKALHVAAVFASNFTNHMYVLAAELCEQHEVPFEILQPLIRETANKVQTLNPLQAQTGPAIRHDLSTIDAHLQMLHDQDYTTIYKMLTQSIQKHGKKL